MSLINQMLQELDARGTPVAPNGVLQGQIRAVEPRRIVAGWWLALVLALLTALCAVGGWFLYRPGQQAVMPTAAEPAAAAIDLPLKLEFDASRIVVPQMLPTSGLGAQTLANHPQKEELTIAQASLDSAQQISAKPFVKASAPDPVAVAKETSIAASVQQSQEVVRGQLGLQTMPASALSPAKAVVATVTTSTIVNVSNQAALVKQYKEMTPQLQAENVYRKGTTLIQQGKTAEAIATLEQALQLDAQHVTARQTLVALLVEAKRQDEAIRRLREGLQGDLSQTAWSMILARLLVERGELKPAIEILQRSLPHAAERADYQAFLGALLQRDGLHRDAVEHYRLALRKVPQNSIWWMGLGISLYADNRASEAIEAFTRAKNSSGLSPELKAFVEEKLNLLQR